MKYKGIELKEITEPQLFNPPKPMLVWDSDGERPVNLNVCAIVLRDDFRVITERSPWRHCAEIPEQPKKLVTYRELARWLAEGNGEMKAGSELAYTHMNYNLSRANSGADSTAKVRKWDDSEWHSPTREYLGLEDE